MKVDREQVAAALFNILQTVQPNPPFPQFQGYSRLYVDGQEYAQQPVLFLVQLGETAKREPSQRLTVWFMHFLVIVLFKGDQGPNASVVPETLCNLLLDSIDQAISIPGQRQQLTAGNNGVPLVLDAWIDGKIGINSGTFDPDRQGMITVPITVMTGQ